MTNKYDSKFSKEFIVPSVSREFIARPALSRTLGDVRGKRILELGCGSGYWLQRLAKKGALCTGIDISKDQIALARESDKTKKIRFVVADAKHAKNLESSFDIVLILNVVVELMDKKDAHALFSSAHRMLGKNGALFVLDMHPMAPDVHRSIRLPKGYHYFKSGIVVEVESRKMDGKAIHFHYSHYTLQDFSEFFSQNGFLIRRIVEPQASATVVRKLRRYRTGSSTPLT